MRRLIINADDFGLTAGVNRAVAEAHKRGIVTSATLMANSRAFDEAVALARSMPSLSVGCHVVLVDGAPILAAHLVPTLLHEGTAMRSTLTQTGLAILRNRLNASEVEAEAVAQISRLQSAGVRVSHFDSHKHTHAFPSILKPLLRAAKTCDVHAVRNPFSPARCLPLADVARRPALWQRFLAVQVLRGFGPDFRRIVERDGIHTTDGCFGLVETGAMNLDLFRALVRVIPEGTWELVCHPGYNDADLDAIRTRLRASRAQEFELLTSPAARAILAEHGVELITFWDVQSQSPPIAAIEQNRLAR